MILKNYIDATYLKTAKEANISAVENKIILQNLVNFAISNQIKCVMIRPNEVSWIKENIQRKNSKILVGTVIDFPYGNATLENKLKEAQIAIKNGTDELDFVINFNEFIAGNTKLIKDEILVLSKLCLDFQKTAKFIIEVAALSTKQIIQISALIKNVVTQNFKENQFDKIFIKSSTGYYKTSDNKPNGATLESIICMLENGSPLPIKASGGIKTKEEIEFYLKLGVKRIGTSAYEELLRQD